MAQLLIFILEDGLISENPPLSNPDTPTKIYDHVIMLLKGKKPQTRLLMMEIVCWTIYPVRPILFEELQDVLEPAGLTKTDLVTICAGFVIVDPSTRTIQPYTSDIRHLLENCLVDEEGRPQMITMTKRCLSYLERKTSLLGGSRAKQDLPGLLQDHPFLYYAVLFWGRHDWDNTMETDSAMRLLKNKAARKSMIQIMHRWRDANLPNFQYLPRTLKDLVSDIKELSPYSSAVHFATVYGLPTLADALKESGCDLPTKDSNGDTAWMLRLSNR